MIYNDLSQLFTFTAVFGIIGYIYGNSVRLCSEILIKSVAVQAYKKVCILFLGHMRPLMYAILYSGKFLVRIGAVSVSACKVRSYSLIL